MPAAAPQVLAAVPAGPRVRFIDFGDAAWTHPFLSLMPLLLGCHGRWALPASFGDSLDQPSLHMIVDSYLHAWTDYASLQELRDILGHALRLAPLRRSRAIITNIKHATCADTDDLGATPWELLTAVPLCKPTTTLPRHPRNQPD